MGLSALFTFIASNIGKKSDAPELSWALLSSCMRSFILSQFNSKNFWNTLGLSRYFGYFFLKICLFPTKILTFEISRKSRFLRILVQFLQYACFWQICYFCLTFQEVVKMVFETFGRLWRLYLCIFDASFTNAKFLILVTFQGKIAQLIWLWLKLFPFFDFFQCAPSLTNLYLTKS